MVLDTERLLLRPMEPADIPFLTELWTDPCVTRYVGGPRDAARLQESFDEDLTNPSPPVFDLWPVVEKATGRLVGHCGLLDKEVDGKPEIDLVYVFRRAAWGQGYATEIARALVASARDQLGLQRLIALIDPENTASQRVARAAGMVFERETVRPGGRLMRVYSIDLSRHCPG